MGWSDLSAEEKTRTLGRAKSLGLSEANLSSPEDLIVGAGGVSLDARRAGAVKGTPIRVNTVDDLVRLFGHPEVSRSNRLVAMKTNERRGLLRVLKELESPDAVARNVEGRTLNQVIAGLTRRSIKTSELTAEQSKAVAEIAGRVVGIGWLFANIVIEAGNTLSFDGSGPHALIANKITIKPGGRIVSNRATVQITCNTLEVQ